MTDATHSIYEIWHRAGEKFVKPNGRIGDYMESTYIALSSLPPKKEFEHYIAVLSNAKSVAESAAQVAGFDPDSDTGKTFIGRTLAISIVNTEICCATATLVTHAESLNLHLPSLPDPDNGEPIRFEAAIDRVLGKRRAEALILKAAA